MTNETIYKEGSFTSAWDSQASRIIDLLEAVGQPETSRPVINETNGFAFSRRELRWHRRFTKENLKGAVVRRQWQSQKAKQRLLT